VRDLPDEFDADALIRCLADDWGFDVDTIDYAPVGFGSYHWVVSDSDGRRGFVTVDDLDRKPWLGITRNSAFDGMVRAFGTAVALRDAGLDFVLAPIPTGDSEAVRRIGVRYSVAVFPFVEGHAGAFGEYDNAEDRAAVVPMVARIHLATSAVESIVPRIDLDLPGRDSLEAGLRDINQTWSGGPYAEPARKALAARASDVAELLGLFDRLAHDVATRRIDRVVTHGEPHAANVIRTDTKRVLIDWDTVALAPPERDLWMLIDDADDTGAEATAYADATGHQPDPVALDFFRLTWDLADLAAFVDVLRAPHRDSDDTLKVYNGLRKCVAIRDRWAALLA
jgi:spectinomycin phosphotransferase